MASFADLLAKGQPTAEQLFEWAVLQQFVGAIFAPAFTEVTRAVNSLSQTTPLSPAQLADMEIKGHLSHADAEAYAKQSGIAPSDFQRMVDDAGEPPGLTLLLEAFRRGYIEQSGTGPESTSLEQGIRESRLKDKWIAVIEKMGLQPIPVADAIDAWVKGQITPEFAQHIAYLGGVAADDAAILYNTRGNPPSPAELAVLLKRGLIPMSGIGPDQVSFQQGIAEGASRNKWWELFAKLADYIPPPRTVTAMVREGSLSDDEALPLYQDAGLTPHLAAAYLTSAHHQKTAAHRDLAVSQIKALYVDRLIDAGEARAMLEALKYNAGDQAFLLDLWDFEALQTKVKSAVAKIHNLYVAHKIDAGEAGRALDGLHIPAAGRDENLTIWNLERDANVPHLTRAEVVDAWFYGVVDQAETDRLLAALGWTAEEAAILRGIRAHGKQPPATRP